MNTFNISKEKGGIKKVVGRQGLLRSPFIDNAFALFYNSTGSLPEAEAMTFMTVKYLYSLFMENYDLTNECWRGILAVDMETDHKKEILVLGGYEKMERHFGSRREVQKVLAKQREAICKELQKYEVGKLFSETYKNAFVCAYNYTKSRENAKDVVANSFQKLLEMQAAQFFAIEKLQNYFWQIIRTESLNEIKRIQKTLPITKDIEVETEDLLFRLFSQKHISLKIQTTLNRLNPSRYAEIIRLYYWKKYSHEVIASEMGLKNTGASRTLLSRARDAFEKLYQPPYSPDDDPGSATGRLNQQPVKKQNHKDWPGQNGGTGNGDITDFVVFNPLHLETEILAGYAEMVKDFDGEDTVNTMLKNEKRKLAKQLFGETACCDGNRTFPTPKVGKFWQENKPYLYDTTFDKFVAPEIVFYKPRTCDPFEQLEFAWLPLRDEQWPFIIIEDFVVDRTIFRKRKFIETLQKHLYNYSNMIYQKKEMDAFALNPYSYEKEQFEKQEGSFWHQMQETTTTDESIFVYYSLVERNTERTRCLLGENNQEVHGYTLGKTSDPPATTSNTINQTLVITTNLDSYEIVPLGIENNLTGSTQLTQ